ncbi:MAG: hypothetical protein SF066_14825 [Thermoanaerobaculia bacterium]|nr:hypothetical protein [Thermoanaerobaculia bacterium]
MIKMLGAAGLVLATFAAGPVAGDLERFTPSGPPLGCLDSVVVQPSGRWLIATSVSGVSASDDSGASWASPPSSVLVADPPRALARGRDLGAVFAAGNSGLYYSPDGARTWQYRGPLPELAEGEDLGRDLLVHSSGSPTAAGTLYLARGRRLLRSRDGGVRFFEVLVTPTPILSLDADPERPARVFVGIQAVSISEPPIAETFYASSDAGRTWRSHSIHGDPNLSVAVSRLRFDRATGTLFAISGFALFRTDDLGRTWRPVRLREGQSLPTGGYTYEVLPAQGAPGSVFAVHQSDSDIGLLLSRDRGETWRRIAAGDGFDSARLLFHDGARGVLLAEGAGEVIELHLRTGVLRRLPVALGRESFTCFIDAATKVRFLPSDPATVFVTSRGALWTSRDRGRQWSRHPSPDSFRDLATRAERPDEVLAATDQGLALSTDGGRSFHRVGDLPVAALVSWLADGTLLAAGTGVFRSENEGRTLTMTLPDLPDNGREGDDDRAILGLFADPLAEQRVYAAALDGYGRHFRTYERPIYRSEDGGATWQRLSREGSVLSLDARGGSVRGARLLLWAATTLEESLDGGNEWTVLSALAEAAPHCEARTLVVDPRGNGLLWVACGDGVRRSTDGGRSFAPVAGSEGQSVVGLFLQEQIRGRLWAVTEGGIWVGRFALPS